MMFLRPHLSFARHAPAAGLLALLTACGGGGGTGNASSDAPAVESQRTIRASSPADGDVGVERSVRPALTLSRATASDSIRLGRDGDIVAANVDVAGNDVRITPARRLLPLTTYRIEAGDDAISFTTADGAWGAPLPIENGPSHTQEPDVAADAQGNAMAVWRLNGPASNSVWASRLRPADGWSAPELLGAGDVAKVTMDAAGNAVAMWTGLDGPRYALWTRRYAPDTGWGPAEVVDGGQPDNADKFALAGNAQGDVVVTWLQVDGASARYNVFAKRYVPGTGWQAAQLLEHRDTQAYDPAIAIDAAGTAMVLWMQTDLTRFNVMASWAGRAGAWSAPVEIETAPQSASSPAVGASADGTFTAAWTQPGARLEIWANRFRADAGWAGAVRLDAAPLGAYESQVAMDARGGAVVAWVQNGTAAAEIWASRFRAGDGWSAPAAVAASAFDAQEPRIVADAAGNALVLWNQREATGTAIWARRLPARGSWVDALRLTAAQQVDSEATAIVVDPSGSAIAAWQEFDGATRYKVVFNRFD